MNIHLLGDRMLTRFIQLHTIPALSAVLTAATLPVLAYDGIAEFSAEKLEDILQMFGSQEYQEVRIFGTLIPPRDIESVFIESGL